MAAPAAAAAQPAVMQSTLALDGPQLHTSIKGARLFAFPTIATNELLNTATAEQRIKSSRLQWYATGGMRLRGLQKKGKLGKVWRRRSAILDVFLSVLHKLHLVALAAQATSQYEYQVDGVISEKNFQPMLFDKNRFQALLTLSGHEEVYQGRLVDDRPMDDIGGLGGLTVEFDFPSVEVAISVSRQLDALLMNDEAIEEEGGMDREEQWGFLNIAFSIDGVCESRSVFTLKASQVQSSQLESELFGDDRQHKVAYVTLDVMNQLAARIRSAVNISEVVGVGAERIEPSLVQDCIRTALLDKFAQIALPTGARLVEDLRSARADPDAVKGVTSNLSTQVIDNSSRELQLQSATAGTQSSDISSQRKENTSSSSQRSNSTKVSASFIGSASGEHSESQASAQARQYESNMREANLSSSSEQAAELRKASSSHMHQGQVKTLNTAKVFEVTRSGLNSDLELTFSRGVQYRSGTVKSLRLDLEPGADSYEAEEEQLALVLDRLDGHDRDVVRLDALIVGLQRRVDVHDTRLDAIEEAGRLMPSSTILGIASRTVPPGFLPCDGTTRPIAEFPQLALAIGVTWGTAPPDAFRLPALRGKFLRGADLGDRVDPDANAAADATADEPPSPNRRTANGDGETNGVGSTQQAGFAEHQHGVTDDGHQHAAQHINRGLQVDIGASNKNGVYVAGDGEPGGPLFLPMTRRNAAHPGTTGIVINPTGGKETRPVNAAVLWIIKT